MLRASRTFYFGDLKKYIQAQQQPNKFAVSAVQSLTSSWGEEESGMCSRGQRKISNHAGGHDYENLHGDSASATAANFKKAGLQATGEPKDGDLFFFLDPKHNNGFGHVIRKVGKWGVEVSSRYGPKGVDCRGAQLLSYFGKPDFIGRER